ncbi:hypothetical protein [Sphingomonas crusticola]|uniref:hypothetical protein n=1 Tax=Sphingomonas crusticola TaxID=1697973 RepID=UPI000E240695|nr:hypothetical protein [Sphingomonas crusticola]
MGFSHSWIAVQGLTCEQALDALGMEVSDVQADLLEGVALLEWSDDWLVVLSEDDQDATGGDLAELGRLGRAYVAYGVDVDAPYSQACGREGRNDWVVTVKPDQGRVSVVGQPPAQLDSIIAAARAGQADSEIDLAFEIPAELAESICGFRIGKGDPETIRHVTLKSTGIPRSVQTGRRPGFFARLFGRG